jgi:hypothetical protein
MDDGTGDAERRGLIGRADQLHGAIVQYLDVHDEKQPGAEAPNHASDFTGSQTHRFTNVVRGIRGYRWIAPAPRRV